MGERKDLRDLLKDKDFTQKRIIDDLANSDTEADYPRRGFSGDIRRSEGGDFIKNFFIGVLLICIVVGSFWTSFLIGKKVLVPPIKNFPSLETPAPRAISKLDLEKATSVNEETAIKETEVKQAPIKAVLPRTVSPKKLMAAKQVSSGESEKVATMKQIVRIPVAKMKGPKFYKVIVGTFRTAGEANSFVKTLKTKGFPSYVKEIAGFYRVQAGAYDIREKTKPLVAKLKRKGITPSIILE